MIIAKKRQNAAILALQGLWRTRLEQLWDRLAARRARSARYWQTYHELNRLSDRELADIAIPRAHIRRVALETASQEGGS